MIARRPFLIPSLTKAACAALTAIALGFAPLAGVGPAQAATPAKGEFHTTAPHAILIDAASGSILMEQEADAGFFPASLAKLMTVEVVLNELRQGHIKPTDEYTVSEFAWRHGGAPSRTSSMFLPIHSKASVDDLLHGVIIQSGNDACITLAEGISKNEGEFALKMTDRARQLGLTKSVFTNSTGLPDPAMTVTARELGKLARYIIQTYPDYYKLFGQPEFTWNKIRQYNRNPLLKMSIGADGLKTGFTKEAGYGLVGSAVQNGFRLIVVVAGMKTAKDRANEAKRILEWGFHTFESRMLFAQGQTVGEAKVFGGAEGHVALQSDEAVSLMVPRGGNDKIRASIVYTGPLPAPVKSGQPVGVLRVMRNDNLALEVPLHAANDVGVGTVSQRAFDAVAESVITVVIAGFKRL